MGKYKHKIKATRPISSHIFKECSDIREVIDYLTEASSKGANKVYFCVYDDERVSILTTNESYLSEQENILREEERRKFKSKLNKRLRDET